MDWDLRGSHRGVPCSGQRVVIAAVVEGCQGRGDRGNLCDQIGDTKSFFRSMYDRSRPFNKIIAHNLKTHGI